MQTAIFFSKANSIKRQWINFHIDTNIAYRKMMTSNQSYVIRNVDNKMLTWSKYDTVNSLVMHTRYNPYSLIGHTLLDFPSWFAGILEA